MDTARLEGRFLAMAAKAPLIALHKLLILCSCYGAVLILLHVITVVLFCRISQLSLLVGLVIALASQYYLSALFKDLLSLIAMSW